MGSLKGISDIFRAMIFAATIPIVLLISGLTAQEDQCPRRPIYCNKQFGKCFPGKECPQEFIPTPKGNGPRGCNSRNFGCVCCKCPKQDIECTTKRGICFPEECPKGYGIVGKCASEKCVCCTPRRG